MNLLRSILHRRSILHILHKYTYKKYISKEGITSLLLWQRSISYVQGQEPEPKIREYFYYIDHEGMLFLDDAKMKNFTSCFKEKKFLKFFFDRVKVNNSERYREDFPYLSPCGRERNFIRCDDTPIVFTHVIQTVGGADKLQYNHGGEILQIPFEPEKIFMNPGTGRVYHPAWPKVGNVGLISSKLSIQLSEYFEFEQKDKNKQGPSHIWWRDEKRLLKSDWITDTQRYGVNSNKEIQ